MPQSLQDQYAPKNICFGCGPANPEGLQIKSVPNNNAVLCHWTPQPRYQAFTGVLNGGIIGTLLDCHSNWTAAWFLMKEKGTDHPPCTVTSEYSIKLLRPTPSDKPVKLIASPVEIKSDRAVIDAMLFSENTICAKCLGVFVAVKPGHPAYHRW